MWMPDWSRRGKINLYVIPRERWHEQEFLTFAFAPSATIVDWREDFLETARKTQKRLDLTIDTEKARLTRIGDADKKIFAVINTEYLLARFDENRRREFWISMWNDYPHLNGVVLFCVLDAPALLPEKSNLKQWREDGRLFYAADLK